MLNSTVVFSRKEGNSNFCMLLFHIFSLSFRAFENGHFLEIITPRNPFAC